MQKSQKGFTVLEILVALTIGVFLFAGVLSIFVSMRATTQETSDYGELQENGRFALAVLSDELLRADFWGDFASKFSKDSLVSSPASPTGADCIGDGLNNRTFPQAVGPFRTLWSDAVSAANPINCIADAKLNSDLLQLKRVVSTPVTAATAGRYYLTSNLSVGAIYAGAGSIPFLENSRTWEYQHRIYYIREEGPSNVPVLMQGRLTTGMVFSPLVEGIERIHFEFGIDTNGDGSVNSFIAASDMTDAYWNGSIDSKILAVKVYVLARAVTEDFDYTNGNTYQLGQISVTPNDNFRRLLFSSTVTLHNSGGV
ncbi:PilW family protein [Thalassotalea agarivorans]|uniref:Type IV pilus assembly protein PilW n=1 Tax=Thalassotalea agarivorans TaxID=349064 RepID=A0A1H9YSF5_THASX|nr:PilW family protein [Thalassotalea agarivorans]SES72083.1 type IV pilus assembly protein PilW [Thalassotalea agarivorans]